MAMVYIKKTILAFLIATPCLFPITVLAFDFNAGSAPIINPIVNGQEAGPGQVRAFGITMINDIVEPLLALMWIVLIIFSFIMFLVAAFQFLSAQGEADEINKAKKSLIWGAVGLVVGILAFSIPFIIAGFFGAG